jgi:ankyrin repeat protein
MIMYLKKFCLISLCLFTAIAVPACKQKGDSQQKRSGWTALHEAASNGTKTAEVENLLANGADVNAMDEKGRTPLHLVAFLGHIKTAKVLIDRGANVNAMDDKGERPLHLAADGGWPEIVKLLLDAGADINAKTKGGMTPLDYVNKKINLCERMLQARPSEGPGQQIAKTAVDQMPIMLQRYKSCAEMFSKHQAN